jgi:L-aminopeptidase/D-esterase-like protein
VVETERASAVTATTDPILDPLVDRVEPGAAGALGNTTIGLVVTNAALDKMGCHLVAQSGHDGLARAIVPAHTRFDGDAIVVAATGSLEAGPTDAPTLDDVRLLATAAVEQAVRSVSRVAAGK